MSYSKYKRSGEFRNDRRYQTVRLQRRRGRAETRLKTSVILSGVCILTAAFFLVIGSIGTSEERNSIAAGTEQDGRGGIAQTSSASDDRWNLILVNPWNEIPEDYEVELTELKNGQAVDSRCYPQLQQMMDDCRAAGLDPVICASYRTMAKQEALFNDKKRRVIREGCPASMADKEAAKTVAWPGTSEHQLGLALDIVDLDYQQLDTRQEETPVQSEHQLGLALDIVDLDYQQLDTRQEETPVQQWLMENSWKYGFILRYPTDKSEITGIIYEPWHYRYVGKQAAKVIPEKGICLEEYLENYQQNYPEES